MRYIAEPRAKGNWLAFCEARNGSRNHGGSKIWERLSVSHIWMNEWMHSMRMKEISMTPYPFQIVRVWTVASMPSFSFFSFHFISFHFSFFSFHCAVLLHFSVLCLVCRIERVSKCERARPSLIPKRPCTFHRINLASSVTVLWAIIRVKPALSARTYATVQIGFVRFHRSKSSKKNENRNCFTQFQFGIRSDTYCFHQPKYCECTLASFCCS